MSEKHAILLKKYLQLPDRLEAAIAFPQQNRNAARPAIGDRQVQVAGVADVAAVVVTIVHELVLERRHDPRLAQARGHDADVGLGGRQRRLGAVDGRLLLLELLLRDEPRRRQLLAAVVVGAGQRRARLPGVELRSDSGLQQLACWLLVQCLAHLQLLWHFVPPRVRIPWLYNAE